MQESSQSSGIVTKAGSAVRSVDAVVNRDIVLGVSDRPATEFFVAPGYRPGQREAIERAEAAFQRGARYVIIEAPTGIGKSHIARALAFKYGLTFVVTVQKGLQSQYQADFPDMYVVKGRSAYPCKVEGKTCDQGPCRVKRGIRHDDCPYSLAVLEAIRRPVIVHNFDSFYYQSLHTDFGYRELMIIDEAHNIESKFLGFMEFTISNYHDRTLIIPEYTHIDEYEKFLEMQLQKVDERLAVLEDSTLPAEKIIREMDDLTSLKGRLERYFEFKERGVEYVFDFKRDNGHDTLTIRPVMVGDFVSTYLLGKSKRVLMMSATILDKRIFCESIGIDPDACEFIRMGSVFPAENRPVYLRYVGSMGRNSIDDTLPLLAERIEMILDKFSRSRGIIQTHNDKIMYYIRRNLTNDRLTFRSDYRTVDEMLKAHAEKPGSVIVASGLREGLDLKGDLSRVQIICKMPYPYMGDKRVKRRMELDRGWSSYMTALMFVQMLGRSIRSETDTADTFVLDSDFSLFYRMGGKELLPRYVKEALQR